MKHPPFTKVLASVLCTIMLLGVIPFTAFAASTEEFKPETHTVFKNTESTLAPGVTQNIKYAYAKDGKQMVYYVATADVTRDDVIVQTSYKDQYTAKTFGMQKLTEQIAYANKLYTDKNNERYISDYYNVVAGVNASFYNMTTGQPSGVTYLDGVQIGESSSYNQFFAMTKDGKAVIDYTKNLSKYDGNIDQAVAGSVMLLWDGVDVTANASGSYNTDRHSRTCVGVTADGKVVMMVLDGRQEPFSCGGTMHELAQIMLEAGCVSAINLDGGGSTTYVSKAEGENKVSLVNRPSDGSERTISSGLIIASLAVPSDTFDHVSMTVTDEYVTPGTSTEVKVSGVSAVGSAAVLPEELTYEVTNGTYENGVLTATAVGDVVLTAKYNGAQVGSVTVHAVEPTAIKFNSEKKVISFGNTISFDITATVNNGLNEVKFNSDDIVLSLSNASLGSVKGLSYTAADNKISDVTSGVITARLASNQTVSATINIELTDLPDEPIVYENFESKPYYKFSNRYADVFKYEIVDSTNGQVHSGNYALAVTMQIEDFGLNQYSGFVQFGASTALSGYSEATGTKTFEDLDLTNAQKLGIWIYVPEDSQTSYVQFRLRNRNNYDDQLQYRLYDYGYSTTESGHRGWKYFELNFEEANTDSIQYNDGNYYLERIDLYSCTRNDDYNKDAYNYNVYDQQSIKGAMTFYFDDLTVEYVDTGADFVDPKFDYVRASYGGASDSVELNGQTITSNIISVTARASDDGVGIDVASAKAYIDGVELTSGFRCDELGIMTIDDVTLADGTHTFTFVISDKNGNCEYVTRQVTVSANSGIPTASLTLTEELTSRPLFGQVLWFSLNVDNIEKVDTITTILNLNATSYWELDHMIVADGFEASYTLDSVTNDATLTVEKVGNTVSSGTDTVVQIPIRMHYVSNTTGYSSSMVQPEDIKLSMEKGLVVYTDKTQSTFSMKKIDIDSERYSWYDVMSRNGDIIDGYMFHKHSAKAIADKVATCTEAGYTGRTYCEVCHSVVDWGTTIPATGHSYELKDGQFVCSTEGCGDVYKAGTGLFEMNGKWYYAINDKLVTGWQMDTEGWYYFEPDSCAALSGTHTINVKGIDIEYTFDEKGCLMHDVWYTNANNEKYLYYGPGYYVRKWMEVDGKTYFINYLGVVARGIYGVQDSPHMPEIFYLFDTETCELISVCKGFMTYGGSTYYYHTEGSNAKAYGFQCIEGKYYYFSTSTGAMKTGEYTVMTYTSNGMLSANRTFHFDEKTGYAVDGNGEPLTSLEEVKPEESYPKFVKKNGETYYYKSESALAFGFQCIEGKYYYFSTSTGAMKTGEYTVMTYTSNGMLSANRTFHFDERNGYAVDGNGEPLTSLEEVKPEESYPKFVKKNGETYYYKSESALAFGFQCIEGKYYYFSTSTGAMKTGEYTVMTYTSNGMLSANRTFHFDERNGYAVDGNGEPLTSLEEVKPEESYPKFVKKNGETYYYKSESALAFGFQCIEGKYYYFSTSTGAMKTGEYTVMTYTSNGMLSANRTFHFDEKTGYAVDGNGEPLTSLD